MRGTIKRWHYDEGFGFIAASKGKKDIFCHSRDVKNCYDLDKGLRAINVKIVYN